MSKYEQNLVWNENSSHCKLLSKIKPGAMVLEFGPSEGIMTRYMKDELGCKVYAVEIDVESAKQVNLFCERVITGNIEDYTWEAQYKNLSFDHIIFADVLEHLYDPWQVLKRVKKFLRSDGSVLISLPNIAHNSIIMNLLENKFEYKEVGLLDNTHIRFFTKNSIDLMINEAGYISSSIEGVFYNPEHTEFRQSYRKFSSVLLGSLLSRDFAHVYQFIYELKESANDKQLECKIELGESSFEQLYYDYGEGFSEDNKVSFYHSGCKSVEISDRVQRIRYIPGLNAGVLRDYKFCIVNSNDTEEEVTFEEYSLTGWDGYALGGLVSLNDAPSLYFDLSRFRQAIKFQFSSIYEPIYFSRDDIPSFGRLKALFDELNRDRVQIEGFLSSKTWKVYCFLKRLFKK